MTATPQNLVGVWKGQVPVRGFGSGGNTAPQSTPADILLVLKSDGNARFVVTIGTSQVEQTEGQWRLMEDLLAIERRNEAFVAFKIRSPTDNALTLINRMGIRANLERTQ